MFGRDSRARDFKKALLISSVSFSNLLEALLEYGGVLNSNTPVGCPAMSAKTLNYGPLTSEFWHWGLFRLISLHPTRVTPFEQPAPAKSRKLSSNATGCWWTEILYQALYNQSRFQETMHRKNSMKILSRKVTDSSPITHPESPFALISLCKRLISWWNPDQQWTPRIGFRSTFCWEILRIGENQTYHVKLEQNPWFPMKPDFLFDFLFISLAFETKSRTIFTSTPNFRRLIDFFLFF